MNNKNTILLIFGLVMLASIGITMSGVFSTTEVLVEASEEQIYLQ